MNRIAVVALSPDHLSGRITRYLTEPFASNPTTKVPTALAEFGNFLYTVTAGFAPPVPDAAAEIIFASRRNSRSARILEHTMRAPTM